MCAFNFLFGVIQSTRIDADWERLRLKIDTAERSGARCVMWEYKDWSTCKLGGKAGDTLGGLNLF